MGEQTEPAEATADKAATPATDPPDEPTPTVHEIQPTSVVHQAKEN